MQTNVVSACDKTSYFLTVQNVSAQLLLSLVRCNRKLSQYWDCIKGNKKACSDWLYVHGV